MPRSIVATVATLLVAVLLVPIATPVSARPDPGGLRPVPAPAMWIGPSTQALPSWALGRYQWPVEGFLVAPFVAPTSPWGPGHRGVDLEAAPGVRVAAMGDGVVSFAGVVAGSAWVTVRHAAPDGGAELRTTIGPLSVVAVETGEEVKRGQGVGIAAGTAHRDHTGRRTGLLHVSARVGGAYVDPGPLVGPLVPTLVPAWTTSTGAPNRPSARTLRAHASLPVRAPA